MYMYVRASPVLKAGYPVSCSRVRLVCLVWVSEAGFSFLILPAIVLYTYFPHVVRSACTSMLYTCFFMCTVCVNVHVCVNVRRYVSVGCRRAATHTQH